MQGRHTFMSGFLSAVIQSNNQFEFDRLYEKNKCKADYLNAVNQFGESPLMLAARLGRVQMVRMLAENVLVEINAVNEKSGKSALMIAIKADHEAVVNVLLDPNLEMRRAALLKSDALREQSVAAAGMFGKSVLANGKDCPASALTVGI
jgi:ankyrin repeat protein